MKKLFLAIACVFLINTTRADDIIDSILLWLPNRVLDFCDIFSWGIGVGGGKADIRITRAIEFGAGDGFAVMLHRDDFNRQFGISLEQGHNLNFLYFGCEEYRVDEVCPLHFWDFPVDTDHDYKTKKTASYDYFGWTSPDERVYNWKTGKRDWWEIGAEIHAGIAARFAIHPVEIADFIAGIFFIDFK